MGNNEFLLVSTQVLPPVFKGVILAKQLLADRRAANVSQAIKQAGISRSAFYKYRDFVFSANDGTGNRIGLEATLTDKAGVFSAMTAVISDCGANIVTVNQKTPVDGTATVSLAVCTENANFSPDTLLDRLKQTDGVISVRMI